MERIKAPLLLHYAGTDERVNEGAQHAFNNDTSEARYDKTAADLAWSRTVEFLRKHLKS